MSKYRSFGEQNEVIARIRLQQTKGIGQCRLEEFDEYGNDANKRYKKRFNFRSR